MHIRRPAQIHFINKTYSEETLIQYTVQGIQTAGSMFVTLVGVRDELGEKHGGKTYCLCIFLQTYKEVMLMIIIVKRELNQVN